MTFVYYFLFYNYICVHCFVSVGGGYYATAAGDGHGRDGGHKVICVLVV